MTGIATQVLSAVSDLEQTWIRTKSSRYEMPGVAERERFAAELNRDLLDPSHLAKCELVWVSPDMVDLVSHAAQSLPLYRFQPEALPWPKAFVLFAKPPLHVTDGWDGERMSVEAALWTDRFAPESNGARVCAWLTKAGNPRGLAPALLAYLKPGEEWWQDPTGDVEDDEPVALPSAGVARDYAAFACTLWLLLQQKVAVQRRVTGDRADQRRWDRMHDRPVPDVTVVELRRPIHSTPHEDRNVEPVDWTHRWIVDGHWRNQYHPSTQSHVPTWIAPYVKGPEDKPLVVKRKVHAWVR